MKMENAEFHAETRSSRRESNPPTSAFSAPPREKKSGWETKSFEDCIVSVKYTRKIQRKDFLDDGQFPIVSQEAEFTNGYWDDEADVFKVSTPVVIFGDHTQVLKYVDFDFVLGADGVKILQPCDFLRPKFAYGMPPLTREERASKAKVEISSQFNPKQQAFLDFVLSHYVNVGVLITPLPSPARHT